MRQEEDRDDDAGYEVAEHDLQEAEVAGEGESRRADDRQRGGLGGDDRKADGPPRGRPSAEEVIAQVFLPASKPGAEPGDGRQVGENDRKIEVAHGSETTSSITAIPDGRLRCRAFACGGGCRT